MARKEIHVQYVADAAGAPSAVQLSLPLWETVKKHVLAAERRMTGADDPLQQPEPLAALQEFKDYWDFKYPYTPDVRCGHCGAATENWEEDPAHPFHLTNANLGGLLVFRCRKCGSTVRKKHFRDHCVLECTPVSQVQRTQHS